jgi:hypothetical protein
VISPVQSRLRVAHTAKPRIAPLAERVLRRLGADPRFVEDVLGDLTEEYANRAESDGAFFARLWYVREAVRSTPHVLTSALRCAGRRERARLAACVTLSALSIVGLAFTYYARQAARLEAGSEAGFVVNSVRPVRLPVRVLDAAGRIRRSTGVQFRWISGAPLGIAPSGVATCVQRGDAVVRASLGALAADLLVHCRPVREVYAPAMLDLVVGDSARDVPFDAVGVDGRPVTLLAGRFTIQDSSVATLEGPRIRARRSGTTWVRARFGERESFTSVHVYERVAEPEQVGAGQHLAVPLRLVAGEFRRWSLPAGHYFLAIVPTSIGRERPRLAVADADCRSLSGHIECFARHSVTVFAFHPRHGESDPALGGTLLIWSREDR